MLSIMNNSKITPMFNELEYFTPQLEGWRQYEFTGAAILVALVAFIVQRAVYRTIKRLGSRHINQIIIPSLVSNWSFFLLQRLPRRLPGDCPEAAQKLPYKTAQRQPKSCTNLAQSVYMLS